MDLRITGAEDFARLGRDLKAAGNKDLQRELTKKVGRSTRVYRQAAKQGALQILPYRGGLAEHVAATARIATRTRTTGRGVSVRITGTSRDNLRRMDEEGIVRRPTFGHPPWIDQKIHPGWFTDPLILTANEVGFKDIADAVSEIARQLEAKR